MKKNMNKELSLSDLKDEGLVRIPYPADLRSTGKKNSVRSWKAFCALDERIRSQFPYNASTNMGVGYELKKTPGANLDVKEDFHFTLGSHAWIKDTAWSLKNATMLQFVNDAEAVVNAIEPIILNFAKQAEKEFSLPGFFEDVRGSKDAWFVRFLHYFGGRKEGEEIATPHADKSGFTLHLRE